MRNETVSVELQEIGESSRDVYPEKPTTLAAWEPGWESQFPWLGFGALFGVIASALFMALILVMSDQKAQNSWSTSMQPNSILAGLNAFANLMLVLGAAQGLAIAWWRNGLRGRVRRESHGSEKPNTSIVQILTGARYLGIIAVVSMIAKLVIVDTVLLPQATTTFQADDATISATLSVPQMTGFPTTGKVINNGETFFTTNTFEDGIISPWRSSLGSFPTTGGVFSNLGTYFTGCSGGCESTFSSLGFDYSCAYDSSPAKYSTPANDTSVSVPVFSTNFEMSWTNSTKPYASIIYTGVSFDAASLDGACTGVLTNTRCELRPALFDVDFSVAASDSSVTVSTGHRLTGGISDWINWNEQGTQINGWRLKNYLDIPDTGATNTDSKLAGLASTLNRYLGSSANMTYIDETTGWALQQIGWVSSAQLAATANQAGGQIANISPGSCNFQYGDITTAIAVAVNSLTFVLNTFDLAIGIESQAASTVQVVATQTVQGLHFATQWPKGWGAVAVTLLCVLVVLPSYYGFWKIGGEQNDAGRGVPEEVLADEDWFPRRPALTREESMDEVLREVERGTRTRRTAAV